MKLTLGQAAKHAGRAKGALSKALTNRQISAEKDDRGKLTREQITERGDNLDWTWLRDESGDPEDDMTEPDEIAAAIMGHLRAALDEIEALSEELEETPVKQAAE